MSNAEVERLIKRFRLVLLSWGLAVVVLAGLFSAWVKSDQVQSDRDMCTLLAVFLGGPAPVEGPAGDRGREVQRAMRDYYARRHCPPR